MAFNYASIYVLLRLRVFHVCIATHLRMESFPQHCFIINVGLVSLPCLNQSLGTRLWDAADCVAAVTTCDVKQDITVGRKPQNPDRCFVFMFLLKPIWSWLAGCLILALWTPTPVRTHTHTHTHTHTLSGLWQVLKRQSGGGGPLLSLSGSCSHISCTLSCFCCWTLWSAPLRGKFC